MSRPDCAGVRDVAPDLALGLLDGEARAAALEHLHRCPSCQAVVAELAGVADLLVRLAPEADPPPGFERRVVDATRRDRRARRRWIAAIGAVAAAVAIGSVAVVRVVDAGRPAQGTAAPELATAPMEDANGLQVGRIVLAQGQPARAAVTVDYAVPDGDYELVARSRDRKASAVGAMTVRDGRGTWTGPVRAASPDTTLEMVDEEGIVVCRAAFPA